MRKAALPLITTSLFHQQCKLFLFTKPPPQFSRLLRHPPLVLTVLPCITFHSFISSQTDKQQIDTTDTMQLKLVAAALAGASSVAASADVKRTDKGEKLALHTRNPF